MEALLWFGAGWWVGSRMATGQSIVPTQLTGAGGGCPPGTLCMQAQAPAVGDFAGAMYARRRGGRY